MQDAILDLPSPRFGAFVQPLTTELKLVERELSDRLRQEAADLAAAPLDDLRIQVRAEDIGRALCAPPNGRRALADDIARLAHAYVVFTGENVLDIRLERITDDACRAFHRDVVRTRLLVTYAGPGTQYVADENGEAALAQQQRFKGFIHSMPTGAVAWMRGAQAGVGQGLVHRSPPIASRGLSRLLLAINAPSQASPELWAETDGPVLHKLWAL